MKRASEKEMEVAIAYRAEYPSSPYKLCFYDTNSPEYAHHQTCLPLASPIAYGNPKKF
ncbi:hypothetical protein [Algoriphagus sp.]|uniref:hypothetical protein n=1 Tax=Algoriphagus sp. TaxID=1872435 RepID=UPI003F7305CB